ncbi:hypothetical protein C0993_001921, partial [Termitomyces sp. T159_Od127]
PKRSGESDTSREPATPSRANAASQWRFTPVSPDESASIAATHVGAESDSVKKRREAFRKKLLLENNRLTRRPSHSELTGAASFLEAQEAESAGEDSDHAFQELNALFSNKSKGKGKAAGASGLKSKRIVKLGPGGEPYTPLEKQVLQLKADNPGTILFFEVGYKYRFFGDDAKVAAKELGMVAFQHRNFLVASIPTHRLHVHLKKLAESLLRKCHLDDLR